MWACSTHETDFSSSDPSPPEQKQAFTINHTVRINLSSHTGRAWPKASGTQTRFIVFQQLRASLSGSVQVLPKRKQINKQKILVLPKR